MSFINKEKFLKGMDKAADMANNAADKAEGFIKEKGIDKKVEQAVEKTEGFIKEKGIDKKVEHAVEKTEGFIKEKEIDKKAKKAVNVVGSGISKVGSKMENAFKETPEESKDKTEE